ncbi:MAG: carbohydrate kinase family protein [Chloroflexota bacterium]
MTNNPALKTPSHIFAGQLRRDYFITEKGEPVLDVFGGNLPYAAVGLRIWDSALSPGLMARVGEDYPQAWLDDLDQKGFDIRGIHILPGELDLRSFYVYTDKVNRVTGDPIKHFSRLGLPFPKVLFGYRANLDVIDDRTTLAPGSLRRADLPPAYAGAAAAHLCPLDYMTHSLMPAVFRQDGFSTITLDPSPGYMIPAFWNDIPAIITGLTAFIPAQDDLRNLFEGRSDDLWEMAEAVAAYGCEYVVVKRGKRGQMLYDSVGKKRWEIPAYPVNLVNPTGAGDAFCGGFLAGYRRTYDPLESVLHGNISAAIVAEGADPFFALDVLPGLASARLDSLRQSVRKI